MTTREPLAVHLYDRHVADVVDAGFGDTAVRYTALATADPIGCRLSLSLPVRAATYPTAGPGGRWVRGLLPEGRALAWAVSHFGVPEDDRYGLIALLGRDVAGAVQVLQQGEAPIGIGRYVPMSRGEVIAHVERAHQMGLGLDRERGVRLSLAGVQDKVLLHQISDRYMLPVDGAPSTLIVKPEPTQPREDGLHFEGLATNELFCLLLARRCGLTVANARVEQFGTTQALLVERFDRATATDGSVSRIHQEDLLGALGEDPLLKYETPHTQRLGDRGGWGDAAARITRRGPALKDLAALLGDHIGRANIISFLQAVAFNVAIGNADAHARNYSILLPPDGTVQLAPLYDLVCTRMWDELDSEAAQRINGVNEIDDVRIGDLVAEAVTWQIPRTVARSRVDALLTAVAERADETIGDCLESGGREQVAEQLASAITARVENIRQGKQT